MGAVVREAGQVNPYRSCSIEAMLGHFERMIAEYLAFLEVLPGVTAEMQDIMQKGAEDSEIPDNEEAPADPDRPMQVPEIHDP